MKYLYLILAFLLGLQVAWYYAPRDCIEYKIVNPLRDYDPITLRPTITE